MTLRNNQDRHSPLTSSHRPPLGAQPSHDARPSQGQAGHEPLPPPAAPDARAAGPARPLPGAGRPCLQRGACQARSRQEGSQGGRRAASACVRAGVRPRSVCPCVRVCVCVSVRSRRPPRRRRPHARSRPRVLSLSQAPALRPESGWAGFINMLIVLVVGGESRVKVTRASAPRATTCVRRAARGRERSGERHACDAALKKKKKKTRRRQRPRRGRAPGSGRRRSLSLGVRPPGARGWERG